jgi:erythronate-4-phosphate dehydrogenase
VTLNILADENIPAVQQYFEPLGVVRRMNGRAISNSDLVDVDVLLVRSVTSVNEELLKSSSVKFVGTATSGVDHIDKAYLQSREIDFAYAPGANANSVVEYVLAAIAAIGEKLEQLLAGGTVGIVGYGLIGKALASRLTQLGITHKVFDPWIEPGAIVNACGLDEILACNVISLHAELTNKQPWPSYHLLGSAQLQCIESGSLLINASRGAVIDNVALLQRLGEASRPYSVLDVWESEPSISQALLQRVTLGSAHIAGYSMDGKLQATQMLSAAAQQFFDSSCMPGSVSVSAIDNLIAPKSLSGTSLARYLIQSRYDIFEDDALLRQAVADKSPAAAGSAFDTLRKQYRQRDELAGAKVVVESMSNEDRALVRHLGCEPVAAQVSP